MTAPCHQGRLPGSIEDIGLFMDEILPLKYPSGAKNRLLGRRPTRRAYLFREA